MSTKYFLRPGIGLKIDPRGQVYVTFGQRLYKVGINVPDEQLTQITDLLCDGATVVQLADVSGLDSEACQSLVDSFSANRWVTTVDPRTSTSMEQRLESYYAEGTDIPGYRQNLADTTILVVGEGLLAELLLNHLTKMNFKKIMTTHAAYPASPKVTSVTSWEQGLADLNGTTKHALIVSAGDFWGGLWETELGRAVKASSNLHAIRLTMEGEVGVVGPIISRESFTCWECYQSHRDNVFLDTLSFSATFRPLSAKVSHNAHKFAPINSPGAEEALVGLALGEIVGFAAGTIPGRLIDRIHYFNFTQYKGRQVDLLPSHRCPACGENEFTLTRRVWDEVQV